MPTHKHKKARKRSHSRRRAHKQHAEAQAGQEAHEHKSDPHTTPAQPQQQAPVAFTSTETRTDTQAHDRGQTEAARTSASAATKTSVPQHARDAIELPAEKDPSGRYEAMQQFQKPFENANLESIIALDRQLNDSVLENYLAQVDASDNAAAAAVDKSAAAAPASAQAQAGVEKGSTAAPAQQQKQQQKQQKQKPQTQQEQQQQREPQPRYKDAIALPSEKDPSGKFESTQQFLKPFENANLESIIALDRQLNDDVLEDYLTQVDATDNTHPTPSTSISTSSAATSAGDAATTAPMTSASAVSDSARTAGTAAKGKQATADSARESRERQGERQALAKDKAKGKQKDKSEAEDKEKDKGDEDKGHGKWSFRNPFTPEHVRELQQHAQQRAPASRTSADTQATASTAPEAEKQQDAEQGKEQGEAKAAPLPVSPSAVAAFAQELQHLPTDVLPLSHPAASADARAATRAATGSARTETTQRHEGEAAPGEHRSGHGRHSVLQEPVLDTAEVLQERVMVDEIGSRPEWMASHPHPHSQPQARAQKGATAGVPAAPSMRTGGDHTAVQKRHDERHGRPREGAGNGEARAKSSGSTEGNISRGQDPGNGAAMEALGRGRHAHRRVGGADVADVPPAHDIHGERRAGAVPQVKRGPPTTSIHAAGAATAETEGAGASATPQGSQHADSHATQQTTDQQPTKQANTAQESQTPGTEGKSLQPHEQERVNSAEKTKFGTSAGKKGIAAHIPIPKLSDKLPSPSVHPHFAPTDDRAGPDITANLPAQPSAEKNAFQDSENKDISETFPRPHSIADFPVDRGARTAIGSSTRHMDRAVAETQAPSGNIDPEMASGQYVSARGSASGGAGEVALSRSHPQHRDHTHAHTLSSSRPPPHSHTLTCHTICTAPAPTELPGCRLLNSRGDEPSQPTAVAPPIEQEQVHSQQQDEERSENGGAASEASKTPAAKQGGEHLGLSVDEAKLERHVSEREHLRTLARLQDKGIALSPTQLEEPVEDLNIDAQHGNAQPLTQRAPPFTRPMSATVKSTFPHKLTLQQLHLRSAIRERHPMRRRIARDLTGKFMWVPIDSRMAEFSGRQDPILEPHAHLPHETNAILHQAGVERTGSHDPLADQRHARSNAAYGRRVPWEDPRQDAQKFAAAIINGKRALQAPVLTQEDRDVLAYKAMLRHAVWFKSDGLLSLMLRTPPYDYRRTGAPAVHTFRRPDASQSLGAILKKVILGEESGKHYVPEDISGRGTVIGIVGARGSGGVFIPHSSVHIPQTVNDSPFARTLRAARPLLHHVPALELPAVRKQHVSDTMDEWHLKYLLAEQHNEASLDDILAEAEQRSPLSSAFAFRCMSVNPADIRVHPARFEADLRAARDRLRKATRVVRWSPRLALSRSLRVAALQRNPADVRVVCGSGLPRLLREARTGLRTVSKEAVNNAGAGALIDAKAEYKRAHARQVAPSAEVLARHSVQRDIDRARQHARESALGMDITTSAATAAGKRGGVGVRAERGVGTLGPLGRLAEKLAEALGANSPHSRAHELCTPASVAPGIGMGAAVASAAHPYAWNAASAEDAHAHHDTLSPSATPYMRASSPSHRARAAPPHCTPPDPTSLVGVSEAHMRRPVLDLRDRDAAIRGKGISSTHAATASATDRARSSSRGRAASAAAPTRTVFDVAAPLRHILPGMSLASHALAAKTAARPPPSVGAPSLAEVDAVAEATTVGVGPERRADAPLPVDLIGLPSQSPFERVDARAVDEAKAGDVHARHEQTDFTIPARDFPDDPHPHPGHSHNGRDPMDAFDKALYGQRDVHTVDTIRREEDTASHHPTVFAHLPHSPHYLEAHTPRYSGAGDNDEAFERSLARATGEASDRSVSPSARNGRMGVRGNSRSRVGHDGTLLPPMRAAAVPARTLTPVVPIDMAAPMSPHASAADKLLPPFSTSSSPSAVQQVAMPAHPPQARQQQSATAQPQVPPGRVLHPVFIPGEDGTPHAPSRSCEHSPTIGLPGTSKRSAATTSTSSSSSSSSSGTGSDRRGHRGLIGRGSGVSHSTSSEDEEVDEQGVPRLLPSPIPRMPLEREGLKHAASVRTGEAAAPPATAAKAAAPISSSSSSSSSSAPAAAMSPMGSATAAAAGVPGASRLTGTPSMHERLMRPLHGIERAFRGADFVEQYHRYEDEEVEEDEVRHAPSASVRADVTQPARQAAATPSQNAVAGAPILAPTSQDDEEEGADIPMQPNKAVCTHTQGDKERAHGIAETGAPAGTRAPRASEPSHIGDSHTLFSQPGHARAQPEAKAVKPQVPEHVEHSMSHPAHAPERPQPPREPNVLTRIGNALTDFFVGKPPEAAAPAGATLRTPGARDSITGMVDAVDMGSRVDDSVRLGRTGSSGASGGRERPLHVDAHGTPTLRVVAQVPEDSVAHAPASPARSPLAAASSRTAPSSLAAALSMNTSSAAAPPTSRHRRTAAGQSVAHAAPAAPPATQPHVTMPSAAPGPAATSSRRAAPAGGVGAFINAVKDHKFAHEQGVCVNAPPGHAPPLTSAAMDPHAVRLHDADTSGRDAQPQPQQQQQQQPQQQRTQRRPWETENHAEAGDDAGGAGLSLPTHRAGGVSGADAAREGMSGAMKAQTHAEEERKSQLISRTAGTGH